jgi:hypothetical protein
VLLELRDGFSEHALVKEVAKQLGSDVKALVTGVTGSVVSVGVTSLTQLSGWVGLAGAAVSTAGVVANPTARAIMERQEKHTALKSNDLYYLYQLNAQS